MKRRTFLKGLVALIPAALATKIIPEAMPEIEGQLGKFDGFRFIESKDSIGIGGECPSVDVHIRACDGTETEFFTAGKPVRWPDEIQWVGDGDEQ